MYKITADDINFCDRYVNKLCAKLGKPACDDAIQSGREGMCVAATRFDIEKSNNFKGYSTWWIRTHLYRDHFGFGCTKKDAMSHEKEVADHVEFCYMDDKSAEESLINKDLVQKCLRKLNPNQRSILREMFYHDKSGHDLSREYGKTPESYNVQLRKAKEKLLKVMRRELCQDQKI